MSDSNEKHSSHNTLSYLSYSGHHHNFSLFILSKKLKRISTDIRKNTTRMKFFIMHNKLSLKTLKDEFFGHINDESTENDIINKSNGHRYIDIKLKKNPPTYEIH